MINFGIVKVTIIMSFIIACLFAASCKPKSNCAGSGGGKGGSASISVSPSHYGAYVDSCTIYIKYATLNTPDNGVYDDSQKCVMADTVPIATFTGLTPGLYYFYGKGYHAAYSSYVKGAVNYTMCTAHTQSLLLPTYSYNP